MKVTLHSTYKYVVVEEEWELSDKEIEEWKKYMSEYDTVGSAVLNGYGTMVNHQIINWGSNKGDEIVSEKKK